MDCEPWGVLTAVIVNRDGIERLELGEVFLHEGNEVPAHTLGKGGGVFKLRATIRKGHVAYREAADKAGELEEELFRVPKSRPS